MSWPHGTGRCGIPFTRGPLAHLLRNSFYIGEVRFKGEALKGEQPAIVDKSLFEAVQAKLNQQANNQKKMRMTSEALLAGRIFDDRGNRMTPTHARKGGRKYRYDLSAALLQAQPEQAGSVARVPAIEIETLVMRAVRESFKPSAQTNDRNLIDAHVARVEVHAEQLVIELARTGNADRSSSRADHTLRIPWRKTALKRHREILVPSDISARSSRPIRSETRATLVSSIARGRLWLNELMSDATTTTQAIAKREGCSVRKVNMTISRAFLAPNLVKAAIDGRLPSGTGVARLVDLPAEWSRQYQMLGLAER